MAKLGIANSRMKDFADLEFLASHFDFDGDLLATRSLRSGVMLDSLKQYPLPKMFQPWIQSNIQNSIQICGA